MFPNGYNMPFYASYNIPRMNPGIMGKIAKNGGLFSKFGGLKSINWQGLLNNTSRTLGVINQAIPLVKQVGPMYNNMKSMLKIASLFKDESEPVSKKNNTKVNSTNTNNNTNVSVNNEEKEKTIINNYSNSPNFFI